MTQRKCNATSKRTGNKCGANAMTGSEKCYHHGGKSRAGTQSATFRHGRYSKDLPTRLAQRYHEARADVDLLALREEIALVDSRLADLLLRVDTNEAGHWWKELRRIYKEYRTAEGKADVPAMRLSLIEWGGIIQAGVSDYAAWGEVHNAVEQRRRLVESERKRLVEMGQVISAERAMLLISVLVDIVRSHVTDPGTLAAISSDVRKLTDNGQQAGA